MTKIKSAFAKKTTMEKILMILAAFFVAVLSYGLSCFAVGSIAKTILNGEESVFYYANNEHQIRLITLALTLIILLTLYRLVFHNKKKNTVVEKDERGVNYMGDSTYGSSRWMRENEVREAFEVSDIHDTDTILYGQLGEDGKQVVGYKNTGKAAGTKSTVLIASSGSGKSFTFIRNSIIQATRRQNTSFVVTDPSGELYCDLALYCQSQGMDVHVLNLADPNYSEFWDFLEETINPDSGRIDNTRLNDFATIFMENSPNIEKDFWYKSALNLLKTVIAYSAYQHEEAILSKYRALDRQITGRNDTELIRRSRTEFIPFNECRNLLLKDGEENGGDLTKIASIIQTIDENPTVEFNVSRVYDNLLHFSDLEKELKNIPSWHPAHISYLVYATNDTDNVRKSALQGTQLCFDLFSDNNVKTALSHPGIHIADINIKRSAYFVITSDKTTATKPITSLFFSFLLKDAQDTYDRNAQIAKEQGKENPCLNVDMILDEFFSIGVIQGSPEAAGVSFSNARKRGICFYLAIQSYSQIEALYGRYIKDVILGNCSTLMYMGGNDESTCKFISEFASGDATVLTESHNDRGLFHNADNDLTIRSDHRFLLTVDEARRWKNKVLVVKQGELPLKLNPLPWTDQPCYKEGLTRPTSVYSSLQSLQQRLNELNSDKISGDIDSRINQLISIINPSLKNNENEEELLVDDFVSDEELRSSLTKKDGSRARESKINF